MSNDRRKAPRYELSVPVHIGDITGFTRNFGLDGALIVMPAAFVRGQAIELSLEFLFAGSTGPTRVDCRGTVLRVHTLSRGYRAVAVQFTEVGVVAASQPPSGVAAQPRWS